MKEKINIYVQYPYLITRTTISIAIIIINIPTTPPPAAPPKTTGESPPSCEPKSSRGTVREKFKYKTEERNDSVRIKIKKQNKVYTSSWSWR